MEWCRQIFCECIQFLIIHGACPADVCHDRPLVSDGFHNIPGSRFAFSAYESSTFRNTSECFTKVFGTAYEGYFESVFVDVVLLVCWSEDFRFVDVIYSNRLDDLGIYK